jgi:hypothetical protein
MRSTTNPLFLFTVGLVSWLIPGAGYFMLNERKRAIIIFVTITLTFGIGIYIGSIGVVDPEGAKFAYVGQLMNSPAIVLIGNVTSGGGYAVYGRSYEIGQIYTVISGMLNLLCIVNVIYMAHLRHEAPGGRF